MIGLYAQNSHTQKELCQLLHSSNVEAYTPDHTYSAIIWLANTSIRSKVPVFYTKDIPLPLTLTEWHAFIREHSTDKITYCNQFFSFDATQRLVIDLITQNQIQLTEKESDLIAFLVKTPQHSASRETLLQNVWLYNPEAETHTLESHLYALKQKLGNNADKFIQQQNGCISLL